jgi:hypothetical protein
MPFAKLLLSLLFIFFSPSLLANYTLPSDEWRLISLPSQPPENKSTVKDLFEDDIRGVYGTDWVLYKYDSQTNSYGEALKLNDAVEHGRGHWIIQVTGNPVTLTMPQGSVEVSASYPLQLASANESNTIQWTLTGNPFSSSLKLGDFSLKTNSGACSSTPCDLDIAKTEKLLHNEVWIYDGKKYVLKNKQDTLNAWDGFWAASLESSQGRALQLRMVNASGSPIPYDVSQFDDLEEVHNTQAERFDFKIDSNHPKHGDWSLGGGSKLLLNDKGTGNGSVLLPAGSQQKYAGGAGKFQVEPGKTYTVMIDTEHGSATEPAIVGLEINFYENEDSPKASRSSKTFDYRAATSDLHTNLFVFTVPEERNWATIYVIASKFRRTANQLLTGSSSKVSNIRVFKGMKLNERPVKKPVTTTDVTLTDSSIWKDLRTNTEFFPIFAYTQAGRNGNGSLHYPELSAAGFSGVTGSAITDHDGKVYSMSEMAAAGITRNFYGMGTTLGDRLYLDDGTSNGTAQPTHTAAGRKETDKVSAWAKTTLKYIKDNGYEQSLAGFTIDNENNKVFDRKNEVFTFLDSIGWLNKFPFYSLDGSDAISDLNPWVDAVGVYVSAEFEGLEGGVPLKLVTQDHNVRAHASIAQIQIQNGEAFIPLIMASIINGATGVGFWEDGVTYDGKHFKISDLSWYKNGKGAQLKADIQSMLDDHIIQAPYLNGFWATVTEGDQGMLYAGTRIVGKQAYLLISNLHHETKTLNIHFDRLHFDAKNINFYINRGANNANIINSTPDTQGFKGDLAVDLEGKGYAVLELLP